MLCCFLPVVKPGIASLAPHDANFSSVKNPLYARTRSPYSSRSQDSYCWIISLSEALSWKAFETKEMAPLGVIPTDILTVLYDACNWTMQELAVSYYVLFRNISVQSIITPHFEYHGLNNDGKIRETSFIEGHLTREGNLKANAGKPSFPNLESKPSEMLYLYTKSSLRRGRIMLPLHNTVERGNTNRQKCLSNLTLEAPLLVSCSLLEACWSHHRAFWSPFWAPGCTFPCPLDCHHLGHHLVQEL